MVRLSSSFLIILIAYLTVLTPTIKAETLKIDYLALGDSLAAGQTPYGGKVGHGFTDMISEAIAGEKMLGIFSKEYASSGQTSLELANLLKTSELKKTVENAELITIISGANDFIDEFYDPVTKRVEVDVPRAHKLLNEVTANLTSSIRTIKSLNPSADVYLFGYYFPIPHYENVTNRAKLEEAFTTVNSQLAMLAASEGAHFVDIASEFDKNGLIYLENTEDIHPNESGYQVMADQFFAKYTIPINGTFSLTDYDWGWTITKPDLVTPYKKWTITTNSLVNGNSIDESIFVLKDGSQLINGKKEVSIDGKKIIISSPKQGYKPGFYQLVITNDLHDKSGKELTKTVLMSFTVK